MVLLGHRKNGSKEWTVEGQKNGSRMHRRMDSSRMAPAQNVLVVVWSLLLDSDEEL